MSRFFFTLAIPTFLILSLVIGTFFTFPLFQSFSFEKEKLQIKKDELSNLKEHISNLYKLEEKLKENSDNLKKVNWALPEKISIPQILEFIKKIASENGLIIVKLGDFRKSIPKEKELSDLREISFSFSLAGKYPSFKKFVSSLEENSKIFEIRKVSFSSKKESENFEFKLKIKTYSF